MTITPEDVTSASLARDNERAGRALVPAAASSLGLVLFFAWARADFVLGAVIASTVSLAAAGLLFGVVVPRGLRRASAGGRALVMGCAGLLLVVPAFWTEVPPLLGVAAALLGYAGRRAPAGGRKATAALVVGSLAVLGYVAVYVGDWIAHPGASVWS